MDVHFYHSFVSGFSPLTAGVASGILSLHIRTRVVYSRT